MLTLTRAQRVALKGLHARLDDATPPSKPTTPYRKFRRKVQPILCGGGAVIVPWCGMWIGIEPDGYTHS